MKYKDNASSSQYPQQIWKTKQKRQQQKNTFAVDWWLFGNKHSREGERRDAGRAGQKCENIKPCRQILLLDVQRYSSLYLGTYFLTV